MPKDIKGNKYGYLTVMKKVENSIVESIAKGSSANWWICKCDCGETDIIQQSLLTGRNVFRCKACYEKLGKKQNTYEVIKKQKIDTAKRHKPKISPKPKIKKDWESHDRNNVSGFVSYFEENQYMFRDTFGYPFSRSIAREEFYKLGRSSL